MRGSISGLIPTTYEQAYAALGEGSEARLAANTKLVAIAGGAVGLQVHNAVIVTYRRDGSRTLDSRGWRTTTTRVRMNAALRGTGFFIENEKGKWIVSTGRPSRPGFEFFDGITLKAPGGSSGAIALGKVAQ